jgi:hypothetical protein
MPSFTQKTFKEKGQGRFSEYRFSKFIFYSFIRFSLKNLKLVLGVNFYTLIIYPNFTLPGTITLPKMTQVKLN